MFEKDYLMRLFKEFLDGINEVLFHIKNEKQEQVQLQIEELYNKYFKVERYFVHQNNAETIINTLTTTDNQASAIKCEILAELLFIEVQLCTPEKNQEDLYQKALFFFEYAENNSNIFSENRSNKIDAIKVKLSKIINSNKL